ncbi:HinT-interacting membrane complex protein P80 [Mycoplasmopsis felifaucium]|uniref:Membrane protein P80 n=1 Tax=Mycoplasmopsis felifaucium TaxID=35768 RepID=A0ABZ2RPV6_9BACT
MGKKKESFFERLIKKNAEQENNNVYKSKPKGKRWKIIVTSSVLIAAIATGITVPLVINSTKKNYLQPYEQSKNLISSDYNGSNLNINIGDYEQNYKNETSKDSEKKIDEMNRQIIYYLYNKEQVASAEFEKNWNETKDAGVADVKTYRLSTISELSSKFKKEILDIQNNMKIQFGTDNWETEFNKYLFNTYDGSKTIDEAVKSKVFKSIQNDALRRFRLVSGNKKEEIQRKTKDGQFAFNWWHEGTNKFWNIDGDDLALSTESFVLNDEYKLATPFIAHFLNNEKPVVISEFTLPGIAPANAKEKWNFDRERILKYMFYAQTGTFNVENTPAKPSDLITKTFKPFSHYIDLVVKEQPVNGLYLLNKDAVGYSQILTSFSSSSTTVKSNWGTAGLTTLSELMSSTNFNTFLSMNPKVVFGENATTHIREIDYFSKLEEVRKEIAKQAGVTDENITDNLKASEYNNKINKFFKEVNETNKTGLTDEKYNELIVKPLSELFINNGKIDLIYKIKGINDVYGILTAEGFKLMYLGNDKTFTNEDIFKMIQNDFIIKKKFDKKTGVQYNALSKINRTLPKEEYINIMLNEQDFLTYIKEQNNPFAKDENGKPLANVKYDDATINELKETVKRNLKFAQSEKLISLTDGAEKWITDKANSDYINGFELKDGKVFFTNNKTEDATSILIKFMTKEFLGNGGN